MSASVAQLRSDLAQDQDYNSGDWLLGCAGFPEITPTNHELGEGATLHEMLEGIIAYAVGGSLSSEVIDDRVAALIQNSTSINWTYDDPANTLSAAVNWAAMTGTHVTTALGYTPVNRAGDTMTGFLSAHSDPTLAMHYTTKQYVDALAAGIQLKDPVVVATTANITLSGLQTIDGRLLIAGDRVLVKNQTAAAENGIYVAGSGAWTRATDLDIGTEANNALTFVQFGTAHANEQWRVTTSGTITLGTTALAWALFFASEDISFTAPLVKTGTVVAISANGISDALLRQSAGLSVLGRSANTTGNVADLTAGTDAHVLRRSGTTLGFGLLGDASISALAWSKLTGTPTTLAGYGITDAQPLDADLTALAGLATTGYARRSGTNTWVLDTTIPWSSVSGTPTTLAGYGITDAVPATRTISTTSPLTGGGALSANLTLSLVANGISNALFRQSGALSVVGRSAGTTGDVADIATVAASGAVLRESGSTIGWGTISTAGLGDGQVSYAKMQNVTALSVIGRSANTDGVPAAITAGTDAHVLRRSGTSIGFGTIGDASITALAWSKLTGTPTTLAGYGITDSVPSSRTISTTSPLSGGGDLSTNRTLSIVTNGISNTLFRQSAALSVVGRSASTLGDVADIAAATDAHVLRRSGTTLGFGTIGDASISALAWSKVTGVPGSFSGFATPTASAGLTAIAGIATTAMRSDGAPAISQSISPTWSAVHTFSLTPVFNGGITVNGTITGTGDWIANQSTHNIRTNTSDAADNRALQIGAGGAMTHLRGAYSAYHGNEHATEAGRLYHIAGNVATGYQTFQTGGTERMRIAFDGQVSMTNALTLSNSSAGAGTLLLTSTTAGNGLTIGGDVNLYRLSANNLATDDRFNTSGLTSSSNIRINSHYMEWSGVNSDVNLNGGTSNARMGWQDASTFVFQTQGAQSWFVQASTGYFRFANKITTDFAYLNAIYNVEASSTAYFQANEGSTVNIRLAPSAHANPYNYFRRRVIIGTTDSDSTYMLDVRGSALIGGILRASGETRLYDTLIVGASAFTPSYTLDVRGTFGVSGLSYFASEVDLSGSFKAPIVITTSTSFTLDATHHTVILSAVAPLVTLPSAVSCTRRIYTIIARSSATTATLNRSGTDLIYWGASSFTSVSLPRASTYGITIQSDGTNWNVIGTLANS